MVDQWWCTLAKPPLFRPACVLSECAFVRTLSPLLLKPSSSQPQEGPGKITVTATGAAIVTAVGVVEMLKRRLPGLHQVRLDAYRALYNNTTPRRTTDPSSPQPQDMHAYPITPTHIASPAGRHYDLLRFDGVPMVGTSLAR